MKHSAKDKVINTATLNRLEIKWLIKAI